MTETLLLLGGQTVILTSDDAETLVQNGAAAIRGINNHGSSPLQGPGSKDIFVPITAATCNISQSSDIQINSPHDNRSLQSGFVQVKVDGKELPGFVLDGTGSDTTAQNSVSPQENSYGLLTGTSGKHSGTTLVTTEARDSITSTEFLQLAGNTVTKPVSKSSVYNGAREDGFGSGVYPISSGGELMPPQVEQSSNVSESGGLHNLVKLPLVSNGVVNVEHNDKVNSTSAKKQSDSGRRIVAIIHGDDGTSQSIEIPVDGEAYQFNVPQMVTQEISPSHDLNKKDKKKVDESHVSDNGIVSNASQIFKLSCNDETLQSKLPNNASIFIGDSGEKVIVSIANGEEVSNRNNDVALEPIFIIPELNADSNIPAAAIQVRNAEPGNPVNSLRNDTISVKPLISNNEAMHFARTIQEKRSAKSLLFPNGIQVDGKLSKIPRFLKSNKANNSTQGNHIDWKKITPKLRSTPKVPGSKYLRNIAKRTKFQNLSSLLDTKQYDSNSHVSPTQVNESIVRAVVAESEAYTRNDEGNLLQNPSHAITGSSLTNGKEEALPYQLSPWNSSVLNSAVTIKQESEPQEEKPLTIKVSTGSIYESALTSRGDKSFSPIPSIKCEGNDGPAENSPPLTSIVYFSSEGDEPPQILQLPTGDCTKPLGSKENPIQLVQQGNTFQALQPVHQEQLEQITSLLQQRRLTVPLTAHHDEIYDPKTNMKIVYKVVHPECFVEESGISEDSDDTYESVAAIPKKRRRGRPPLKSKMTKIESTSELEDVKVDVLEPEEETKLKVSRTRSGRISRPPQHKLTDFKHLPAGAKDTYIEYKIQEEDLKPPEQVFYSLEMSRKKRRVMKDTLRLRYSCYTCKKVFVGRIERHYEKFPNHRRDPSLPEENPNSSYSAIKALSDPQKPDSKDEGVGKPVLSPTPGTQASETNGEPSLPIETSATLLEGHDNGLLIDGLKNKPLPESSQQNNDALAALAAQNEAFGASDVLPAFEPAVQTAPPNSKNKRGRGKGRRRGRGSWARSSSSATTTQVATDSIEGEVRVADALLLPSPSPPPPPPPPAPSSSLEQILCSYSTTDIVNAVSKHLCESLTPWKVLCSLADQKSLDSSLHQWQERLDTLQILIRQCREEFKTVLDPALDVKASGDSCCVDCSKKKLRNDLETKKSKEKMESHDVNILSFEDLIKDAVSPVKPDLQDHIQVYDDVASAIGMSGGCYILKQQVNRLPTSVASLLNSCTTPSDISDSLHISGPDPSVSGSCLLVPSINSSTTEATVGIPDHSSKLPLDIGPDGIENEKPVAASNEKAVLNKSSFAALSKVDDCCSVPSFNASNYSGKSNERIDVSSNDLITGSASNLHLPSFSVSSVPSIDSSFSVSSETNMNPTFSVSSESTINPSFSVTSESTINPPFSVSSESTINPQSFSVSSESNRNPTFSVSPVSNITPSSFSVSSESCINPPFSVSSESSINPSFAVSSESNISPPSYSVSSGSNMNLHNHLQPASLSSSVFTTCDASSLTTSLSSSSINMLLNNEAVINGTTSTMSISAPCVTPAPAVSSTSIEVPHFTSGTSDPENPMSGCMTMQNVDNSLISMPSISQVNPMQQIPIGDLDITAEDLPRLLSEGMGMVVGSGGDNTGDGCDAPKLLDTSGDTTDLSEMLFKLQEATVGIGQSQDHSVYTGQLMPSSSVQQMGVHSGQLITSPSLSTPSGSGLTSQGYSVMGQTINSHLPSNLGGKSIPIHNSAGSSAPLLTFTGALSTNSDYCSVSQSMAQQPINSIGDMKSHQDLIGPASNDPCDPLGKNDSGLVDRDTINLNFPVNSLSNSELEDILKR